MCTGAEGTAAPEQAKRANRAMVVVCGVFSNLNLPKPSCCRFFLQNPNTGFLGALQKRRFWRVKVDLRKEFSRRGSQLRALVWLPRSKRSGVWV